MKSLWVTILNTVLSTFIIFMVVTGGVLFFLGIVAAGKNGCQDTPKSRIGRIVHNSGPFRLACYLGEDTE